MEELPHFNSLYELLEFVVKNKLQVGSFMVEPLPTAIGFKSACPDCSWSVSDIIHYSKMGCPTCYNHFRHEILPVIMRAHKAIQHKGKRPSAGQSLEELKQKLAQAIQEERYEDAGELKKFIEPLK